MIEQPVRLSSLPQVHLRKRSLARLRFAFLKLLLLAAGFLFFQNARAAVALPFYDGFAYTNGTTLGAASSGSDTTWTIGNSVSAATPLSTNVAALGYSGLPTATGIGVFLRNPGGSSKERGVDTGQISMTNATLYASFLLNVQSYPASNCPVAYFDDNASASASFQGVGMLPDGRLTLYRNAGIASPGGTNSAALDTNTTYLIVFRYKYNSGSGNDELALWVNPALGQSSETAIDLSINTGGSDRPFLQGFFLKQDVSFNGTMFFDELRLGTNWTDVTPGAGCNPAGFASAPVNFTNTVGGTASFSCIATGSVPSLQWQVSTNAGSTFNNVTSGTGGTTANYTTPVLVASDNGNQYRCIANVSCNSSSATSAVAAVTVIDITGKFFRTAATGNWAAPATWQVSSDSNTWSAALAPPSSLASNIVVLSNHTVTVAANITVDQVAVRTGGKIVVTDGHLTVADAAEAFDLDVAGTLEVAAGSGTNAFGTAGIRFQNGGVFDWNRAAAPSIPTATWQDGSTCRISATAGSNVLATGVAGQSYYDFVYDSTTAGQSARCRLDIKGTNTVIRRDFSITIDDTANASVTINNDTNAVLTVGRNVTFTTGTTTNSNKVLFNNVGGASYILKVGGNFTVTGYLDGFGGSSTAIEFDGAGTQTLSLPLQPFLITSSAMNWLVNSGSTVQLGSTIDGFASFTNNGTLKFSTYQITRGTTLALNAGGAVIGNGTNKLTGPNLATLVGGGTLNLPGLPAFSGGESFLVFKAGTYTGTAPALIPATPGTGMSWSNRLLIDGTLIVAPASVDYTERLYAVTTANQLISFQNNAPAAILSAGAITGLQSGESVVGIEFVGGTLYALGDSSRLYTLDRSTGAATAVDTNQFSPVLSGLYFGLDADPAGLRVVSELDQQLVLDPESGAATVGTALVGGTSTSISGLAYHPATGVHYVADYVNNSIGTLDPVTGVVTTTGFAGIDFSRHNGFDISGKPGYQAYMATPAASSDPQANLYKINLATGVASLVGKIGNVDDNILIRGLAVGTEFSLTSSVNATPTTLVSAVIGGTNLVLSWPLDHQGWTLQMQTNSRAIGLKTNWVDVSGSSSVTSTNFPINKNDPTVFYRMKLVVP